MEKISVLIPTMNRPVSLKRTLIKYLDAEVVPDEIIIVDQSTHENAKLVKSVVDEFAEKILISYFFQEKPSTTVARNTALEHARNEIIICSDDDIDVYPNTLKIILCLFENKNISMLAGLNDNGNNADSFMGYFCGTKSFIKRKKGYMTHSVLGRFPSKEVKGIVETEWAMGFFCVFRKSCIDKWDMQWDENITGYAYPEDLDFSYRYYQFSKKQNYKCIISSDVHVKHLAVNVNRDNSKLLAYKYICNRAYLAHKFGYRGIQLVPFYYTNFCMLLFKFFKKTGYKDFYEAICFLRKNKKNIYNGCLDYKI